MGAAGGKICKMEIASWESPRETATWNRTVPNERQECWCSGSYCGSCMLVESFTVTRNGLDDLLLCKHLGSRGCVCIFHIADFVSRRYQARWDNTSFVLSTHPPAPSLSFVSTYFSFPRMPACSFAGSPIESMLF